MITAEVRKEIAENTLVSCGVGIDWQTLFAKKELSIGFMGGSVTRGYAHQQVYAEAYPQMLTADLEQLGYRVKCACCADPGMDAMQGNLLAEREILANAPDLVFLEYSINETTLRHSVLSFESLLRKLLLAEHPPIVCIFTIRSKNDYSAESFMLPMAEHYGLPCVSLRQGINPCLAAEKLIWEDYADAESHPTPEGHRLLADCLMNLLENAKQCEKTAVVPLPEPWLDAPFANMQYLPAGELPQLDTDFAVAAKEFSYYPTVWLGDTAHSRYEYRFTGKGLVLFFEANRIPEYGSAKILMDGKPVSHPLLNQSVLRTYSIYGWGNAMPVVVLETETPASHVLTVTPTEGTFHLLALGLCE